MAFPSEANILRRALSASASLISSLKNRQWGLFRDPTGDYVEGGLNRNTGAMFAKDDLGKIHEFPELRSVEGMISSEIETALGNLSVIFQNATLQQEWTSSGVEYAVYDPGTLEFTGWSATPSGNYQWSGTVKYAIDSFGNLLLAGSPVPPAAISSLVITGTSDGLQMFRIVNNLIDTSLDASLRRGVQFMTQSPSGSTEPLWQWKMYGVSGSSNSINFRFKDNADSAIYPRPSYGSSLLFTRGVIPLCSRQVAPSTASGSAAAPENIFVKTPAEFRVALAAPYPQKVISGLLAAASLSTTSLGEAGPDLQIDIFGICVLDFPIGMLYAGNGPGDRVTLKKASGATTASIYDICGSTLFASGLTLDEVTYNCRVAMCSGYAIDPSANLILGVGSSLVYQRPQPNIPIWPNAWAAWWYDPTPVFGVTEPSPGRKLIQVIDDERQNPMQVGSDDYGFAIMGPTSPGSDAFTLNNVSEYRCGFTGGVPALNSAPFTAINDRVISLTGPVGEGATGGWCGSFHHIAATPLSAPMKVYWSCVTITSDAAPNLELLAPVYVRTLKLTENITLTGAPIYYERLILNGFTITGAVQLAWDNTGAGGSGGLPRVGGETFPTALIDGTITLTSGSSNAYYAKYRQLCEGMINRLGCTLQTGVGTVVTLSLYNASAVLVASVDVAGVAGSVEGVIPEQTLTPGRYWLGINVRSGGTITAWKRACFNNNIFAREGWVGDNPAASSLPSSGTNIAPYLYARGV